MSTDPRIEILNNDIREERLNFEALKLEHQRRVRYLQNQVRKVERESARGPALIALDGVLNGAGDFVWITGAARYVRPGQPTPHAYRRATYKDQASHADQWQRNEAGLRVEIYLRDEIKADGNTMTTMTARGRSYGQGRLFDRKRELPAAATTDEEKEAAAEAIARTIIKDVLNKKSK